MIDDRDMPEPEIGHQGDESGDRRVLPHRRHRARHHRSGRGEIGDVEVEQVVDGDDPDDTSIGVDDRQCLDVVLVHQQAGPVERVRRLDHLHVASHDRSAAKFAEATVECMGLGVADEDHDVGSHDVQALVEAGHGLLDVVGTDTDPGPGAWVGADRPCPTVGVGQMRISPAGEIVDADRDRQQDQRVDTDRPERERETVVPDSRPTERSEERAGSAWRMQAPQRHHQRDGCANSDGCRDHRVVEDSSRRNPDECRRDVPDYDGPRLGERAGRRGKDENGGRAHRSDDERQCFWACRNQLPDDAREQDPNERTERPTEVFGAAEPVRPGAEFRQPGPAESDRRRSRS